MDRIAAARRAAPVVLLAAIWVAGCADPGGETADGRDVCVQAADIVEECHGTRPEAPAEGCVGEFATTSQQIVDGGCDAASVQGGKADSGGFWCLGINRWLGLCRDVPTLAEAAELPPLAQACAR